MRLPGLRAAACAVLCAVSSRLCGQQFALHDHDIVVFYGDSITAQRFYTRFVEEFVLTRYPALHVTFINAGVPGDTVYGGYAGATQQRVQRDVSPFQPTMITVMFGMNDGGYGYTPAATVHDNFLKGYAALLDALHTAAPASAITLIDPTPYDEVTHSTDFPGYSKMIAALSGDVDSLASTKAAEGDLTLIHADFFTPAVSALERARASEPSLAALLIPDRIHPAEATHWIMAAALMSAWHIDPVVTGVTLDAQARSVAKSERTVISGLARDGDDLRWTQLDEALPLPLDLDNVLMQVVLRSSKLSAVDQQTLCITGLAPGSYHLLIDGKIVGSWTSDALASGINLALVKTPMLEQARGIDATESARMKLDQARFILQADVKPTSATPSAAKAIEDGEHQLDTEARAQAASKPHHFELRRATL